MKNTSECDFYNHIFTTLNLLGAPADFVAHCRGVLDRIPLQSDVDLVRRYNCDLIDGVKARLANLPTIKLIVR